MAATDGAFDLYAEFLSPFLQEEALCNFFKGNDFFSAHTGNEKSLISQAILIIGFIADVLK
jgi:hypothetical protein